MAISPQLDTLLTRWIERGTELRKEIAFQRDLIAPVALAAHGNRLTLRQRRQRDLRELEQSAQEAQTRWAERLHRIEEWAMNTADLQQRATQLFSLLQSSLWLKKARSHQESFVQRLERRANVLDAARQAFHDNLMIWIVMLQEREYLLNEMNDKDLSGRPLFVSRARKQPEIDFVSDQQALQRSLAQQMFYLRYGLRHVMERLQRAITTVETQMSGAELLYEVHKQEILTALRGVEKILQERRAEILLDALEFEGGQHLLRRVQRRVEELRCLEDLPREPRRGLRRLLPI